MLDLALCDKVFSVTCGRSVVFSGYSANKTVRHNITAILLKVALSTIPLTLKRVGWEWNLIDWVNTAIFVPVPTQELDFHLHMVYFVFYGLRELVVCMVDNCEIV